MRRAITMLVLLELVSMALSNDIYAQLPFEPFVAYSDNPVLPSDSGSWDEYAIWWANVISVDDTFYMTYMGTNDFPDTPLAIGLATSSASDGFNYVKSLSNPIIAGDGTGFDAYNVTTSVLFCESSTWYIYYAGRSSAPNQQGNIIGRAISNISPHGPWTRSDDTLLAVGNVGEWDSGYIGPLSIIISGSVLFMYYWAGMTFPINPQIGLAFSTDDGLTWEKYDDPTTTSPPYAESDPVLKSDEDYDILGIFGCTVSLHDEKWEMFYGGKKDDAQKTISICYAKSEDGVIWNKDDLNNPIFTPLQDPLAITVIEQPAVVRTDSLYFMYYDYFITPDGIGLATAEVIDTMTSGEVLAGNIPLTFSLRQNYPNPFNPKTRIKYSIPQTSKVVMKVFDILGNEIETLVNEEQQVGTYEIAWYTEELPSGVYFYQLRAFDPSTGSGQDFCETKKMVLIK